MLLLGTIVWLPLMWGAEIYPVLNHRTLMMNGFSALFIAGFLMTAVPRFSETDYAKGFEISAYVLATFLVFAGLYLENPALIYTSALFQPLVILFFIVSRFSKRKSNPPYSFIFLFLGVLFWSAPYILSWKFSFDDFKYLHDEGAIAAFILGVGSRLIPGILGHTEIVQLQRKQYERPGPIFKTVPAFFWILFGGFALSFGGQTTPFLTLRFFVVTFIAFYFWKLHHFPAERTALTWSIWAAGWSIVISYLLRIIWPTGDIHAMHIFFFSGTLLLTLLISIRVLQSHGPNDKTIENRKSIYWITGLILFAAATRVSAILMPKQYLSHLGYSALVLIVVIAIWSSRFLIHAVPKK